MARANEAGKDWGTPPMLNRVGYHNPIGLSAGAGKGPRPPRRFNYVSAGGAGISSCSTYEHRTKPRYNSPWIAEAGQNLAAALAPPDPEKTLAAQRNKWLFERQQQLAQLQDEDRAASQAAEVSLGALLSGAGAQPATPTSPGEAAFFSANPAAAGPTGMDEATFQQHVQTALRGGRPIAEIVTAAVHGLGGMRRNEVC
jgi:hypothetical protein